MQDKTSKSSLNSTVKLFLASAIIAFVGKTYILKHSDSEDTGKFATFEKQHTKEQLEKDCPPAVSQRFYQCVKADFYQFISDSDYMESLEILAFMRGITKMDSKLEVSSEGKFQSQINFLTISKFIIANKDTSPTHQEGHGKIIEDMKLQIAQSNLPDEKKQMFKSELDGLHIK